MALQVVVHDGSNHVISEARTYNRSLTSHSVHAESREVESTVVMWFISEIDFPD